MRNFPLGQRLHDPARRLTERHSLLLLYYCAARWFGICSECAGSNVASTSTTYECSFGDRQRATRQQYSSGIDQLTRVVPEEDTGHRMAQFGVEIKDPPAIAEMHLRVGLHQAACH